MGGEIGLLHLEWRVNCFWESCFQPNEDHTEEKKKKKSIALDGSLAKSDKGCLLP